MTRSDLGGPGSRGYHPLATEAAELARRFRFREALVVGPGLPEIVDHVDDVRVVLGSEVQLPTGVYWFADVSPSAVLVVNVGAAPGPPSGAGGDGTALDAALDWFELLWQAAAAVPSPKFKVLDDVLTRGSGQDGVVRARHHVQGQWMYSVFVGGRNQRVREDSLVERPVADSPHAWIDIAPVESGRLAATLTRAKLDGRFTDTVFSYSATRTIFRPYQFKPVMKMLSTGSLRLLIADEVGLGKTIEAGLLWTELEARRQADRVLVVCPSALSSKWQREMEERFGFELVELTNSKLNELQDRLESGRVPARVSYVCTVERLRKWESLGRVTELGLRFDLVIVDEAHVFRNSGTKSQILGEHLSQWADALVFLSATPVNLREGDLLNLLELLVPGEFPDLEGLQERIEPNLPLNRIIASLHDSEVSTAQRLRWLAELQLSPFGRILTERTEFSLLEETLRAPALTPGDIAKIKRLCAELHGLSAQVTRTRKVDVQEDKAIREPHQIPVVWTEAEQAFYTSYLGWCVQRAQAKDMPLNFAMQMPLRLAGSCLPEAADYVQRWSGSAQVGGEVDRAVGEPAKPDAAAPDIPPSRELVSLAAALTMDTKLERFDGLVADLLAQGRQGLIFTFSRRTLAYLSGHLRHKCRVAVLHGGVDKAERDRIMADFRAGDFDLVVATKVASEGLDFEFCSALINYDLPWNPMEIEQRIGRLDRIGQTEEKIAIFNFVTPGTIETDIIERVMARIGVFEHAIGSLEPILGAVWKEVESALLDFSLTEEQRERRAEEILAALAEQQQSLADVEAAAPFLISSDGADIEGLESDLLASGRYVGQAELAHLVTDWVATYGGSARQDGATLVLRGNAELAGHVQSLVGTGVRTAAEVDGVLASIRNESQMHLTLDPEHSRTGSLPLLTATHPLVRAALSVPGHRQSRHAAVHIRSQEAGVPAGHYIVLMVVAHWDGVRPLHEIWTTTVDVSSGSLVTDLGDSIMRAVATGALVGAVVPDRPDLHQALDVAADALLTRQVMRAAELELENRAFHQTRLLTSEQAHQRRLSSIRERTATLRARGRHHMVPLFDAQARRERDRHRTFVEELSRSAEASLSVEDLAVCQVQVTT